MAQPPTETLTEFEITDDLRRIIDTAYVPNDRAMVVVAGEGYRIAEFLSAEKGS